MDQNETMTVSVRNGDNLLQTLLTIYLDERRSANLNEQFRETSSRIVIGANTLLIAAAIGTANKVLALGLCIIAFAISHIGQNISLRYYTVTERYYIRARQVRAKISGVVSGDETMLETLLHPTDETFAKEFGKRPLARKLMRLRRKRLFLMWHQLHNAFKYLSAILTVWIAYLVLTSAYKIPDFSLGEILAKATF